MPQVSIIMPTYNRADTILRAIRSIQAQTFDDWELIVVDDGSVDNTVELLKGIEPRMSVHRQENHGYAWALNVGLQHATGAYLAFLDSDDEWLPHHLELCVAFLKAHSAENFVTTIFIEDFGQGRHVLHPQVEICERHPVAAARIKSRLLDLPPGETDRYLAMFDARAPIGDWGKEIVARTPYQNAFHYSGQLFEHCRWGFVMGLGPTVFTRQAFATVGYFDTRFRAESGFGYMVKLCKNFRANYLSVPTYVKHELAPEGKPLSESHLAKGKTMPIFAKDMLRWHEELFCKERPDDPELAALRSERQFYVAKACLLRGLRDEALHYFTAACRNSPAPLTAQAHKWFVKLIPHAELCRKAYDALFKINYTFGLLRRGEITPGKILGKFVRRLFVPARALKPSPH